MANDKLGRPTDQRLAVLRNQVSYLLWYGKIETSVAKAKAVASKAEKMLTLAINTYEDNEKTTRDGKEVIIDGTKKLAARRKLMSFLYDLQEQRMPKESAESFRKRVDGVNHPLIEKIFNVYAPKYADRAKELGTAGGYTRVIKTRARRGDASELAIVELV
jgi:large subunit ribosomal protein L17